MPPRQKSLTKGRWRAIALSLLVHAAIVAAAVFGWFTWKHEPPENQTLAIEATVVDARALQGVEKLPETVPEPPPPTPEPEPVPEPEPPPPEEQGPPKPDPAEIERREEEERLARDKVEQEKQEQLAREQEKAAQERQQQEEAQRIEAEKQAAAKAAAEKKRVEDAAAAKKAADEKARVAREAELRRSLEAEERANAMRNSDAAARWHAQIVARIQRAWIKPPSAQPGIECIVSVSQVPGGEVTSVRVDSCSGGDAALRESVEAAVYRASPLPPPPDAALFERNLELTFRPQ